MNNKEKLNDNFRNITLDHVESMKSSRGNKVANQYIIHGVDGSEYFQSYKSLIAFKDAKSGKTFIDPNFWDYSVTTGKFRNIFLNEKKRETEKKLKDGDYTFFDLNSFDALDSAFLSDGGSN